MTSMAMTLRRSACRWLPVLLVGNLWAADVEAPSSPPLVPASHGPVFVLPVKGPIDKSLLFVFRRAFRQVDELQPAAIIIELDTPGGGLHETEEITAWMRSVKVPTYAFVNPRALSAGAIISLGTQRIFMSEGARIGSAMPILVNPMSGGVQEMPEDLNEKILSDTRALVRVLAQERGHDADVAMAMVDRQRGMRIGDRVVCKEGELLNLTAREAVEVIPPRTRPLLAEAIVVDIPALLDYVGLLGAEVTRFEETSSERLARYITLIGPILLALGALGIYIEIKTPGFGLPGILGITFLAVYFFGHFVAGLAGFEDIALVVIGLVLLAVEIFVLPGFGVVGVAGIVCIVAGVVLGMVPHIPVPVTPSPDSVSPVLWKPYLEAAVVSLAEATGLAVVLGLIAAHFLPKTEAYHQLVLHTALDRSAGYVSGPVVSRESYVGREGVAITLLRPAGTVAFGDDRLDVVTSGDFVAAGARVRVVEVQGARMVVEPLPEAPKPTV